MEPTDTRDEIEEDTLAVPFGLQGYVFVREQLVAVEEREAVRVVGVALVGRCLP